MNRYSPHPGKFAELEMQNKELRRSRTKAPSQVLPSTGQSETILLVEDETALLFISTQTLTRLGYRVLSATNGLEALKLWEQNHNNIDLVLTDMRMPKGISGLELAAKLWNFKPSLKIIIMSGYSMETTQNNSERNRRYTFLAKPFDRKILSDTVRNCLDLPALARMTRQADCP